MAKKNNPIIPHTEVICLAINALDVKIREWRSKCPDTDAGFAMFCEATEDLRAKREALKQMYLFETGTEYVD